MTHVICPNFFETFMRQRLSSLSTGLFPSTPKLKAHVITITPSLRSKLPSGIECVAAALPQLFGIRFTRSASVPGYSGIGIRATRNQTDTRGRRRRDNFGIAIDSFLDCGEKAAAQLSDADARMMIRHELSSVSVHGGVRGQRPGTNNLRTCVYTFT